MIQASMLRSKASSTRSEKRLSDLPVSGFLATDSIVKLPDRSIGVCKKLTWTARSDIRRRSFTNVQEGSGEAMLDARHVGSRDGSPNSGHVAFRQGIIQMLEQARTMPDGSPGLLLVGDRLACGAFRRMPAGLLKALVADIAWDQHALAFDREVLVTSTIGMKSEIFIALERTGRLTAACFTQRQRRNSGFNRNARLTRAIEFPVLIEWQGKTALKLADFEGLSPPKARKALQDRFWKEVAPAIKNPFVNPKSHGMPVISDLGPEDIRLEKSDAGAIDLALRALAVLMLERGAATSVVGATRPLVFDRIGIETAIPLIAAKPNVTQTLRVSRGVTRILERIVAECRPSGHGLVSDSALGAAKDMLRGNRLDDMVFSSNGIYATLADAEAESGHFRLEAEDHVEHFLVSLGLRPGEAQKMIGQIEPDDGPWKFG